MKVAVVSTYALDHPGGVQDQVIEISSRLALRGIDAWAVGPGRSGPPDARLLGPAVTVPANGSRAPIALNPAVISRVAEAVNGADVVHVHEPLVPLVGWALLRSTGIPTVGTFHADPSRLIRAVYRRLGPVMARLVKNLVGATAVSEVAASAVRPFHPDLAVVPNALDISQYRLDVERTPHRVAFLGRDEPRKGLDVLLAAWPAIRAAVPDAELDVVGAMRAEKIPGVRFLGRVENPEKRHVLASASVFVAPNLGGESFGITLLEGMAAGCAVIASDLPAFTAVGGNGAIYFPKGSAEALAESVARVLLDPTIRQAMSQAGGLRAEVFDWTTVLPAYIEMYEAARRDR